LIIDAMKIERITGGFIDNFAIFPFADGPSKPSTTRILKFSKDARNNPEFCENAFIVEMRKLPAGFYTLVHESGYVVDFCVGKRHGVRVRPYDGKTINRTKERPWLRVTVEKRD